MLKEFLDSEPTVIEQRKTEPLAISIPKLSVPVKLQKPKLSQDKEN